MMLRRSLDEEAERGSVTLFVVVVALILFAVIGLVVDGGGKVRAIQRADYAAQEAARAAGQHLQLPEAVRGQSPALDTGAAARAARAYLASASVQGSVSVQGQTISITTTTSYDPVFVKLIGGGPMTVTGQATARAVRGITEGDS